MDLYVIMRFFSGDLVNFYVPQTYVTIGIIPWLHTLCFMPIGKVSAIISLSLHITKDITINKSKNVQYTR